MNNVCDCVWLFVVCCFIWHVLYVLLYCPKTKNRVFAIRCYWDCKKFMYFCLWANRNVIYLRNLMQKIMQRIVISLNSSGESLKMEWKCVAASNTTTNCIRWKWFNSFYLNSFAFHLNNYSVRKIQLEMFYACAVFIFRPNVDIRCGRNHIVPFEASARSYHDDETNSVIQFIILSIDVCIRTMSKHPLWIAYSYYTVCVVSNIVYLFVSGFYFSVRFHIRKIVYNFLVNSTCFVGQCKFNNMFLYFHFSGGNAIWS